MPSGQSPFGLCGTLKAAETVGSDRQHRPGLGWRTGGENISTADNPDRGTTTRTNDRPQELVNLLASASQSQFNLLK